jgi:septal ring factor EnvC (AmiA/AmiB activator)
MNHQQLATHHDRQAMAHHLRDLNNEIALANTQRDSIARHLEITQERLDECRAHDRNTQCYADSLQRDIDRLSMALKIAHARPIQAQQDLDQALDALQDVSTQLSIALSRNALGWIYILMAGAAGAILYQMTVNAQVLL